MNKKTLPLPLFRKLYFTDQVDQKSIADISKSILEINDNDHYLERVYDIHEIKYTPQPIEIYIDSYGGYVYQCFGLVGIIETSKTPIHTYVTGCAMSAGFIILISGHKRFAYNHSTPLYHQVANDNMNGKLGDLDNDVKELKRLQSKIEELTLKKTKITKKQLNDIYIKKHDWFMTAKDALKLGVVDEIII